MYFYETCTVACSSYVDEGTFFALFQKKEKFQKCAGKLRKLLGVMLAAPHVFALG